MKRSSLRPHRLTSLPAASLPAACATISSVPPAMGVHFPGALAISSSTALKVGGAIISWAAGLPRMRGLPGWTDRRSGGGDHRLNDAREAGTATEIAGQAFTDLPRTGIGVEGEQLGGGHQPARGANAELGAAAGKKRPL